MKIDQTIFKAYDIRGLAGQQISPEIAYLIGRAYIRVIKPRIKIIGVGMDVRIHGIQLKKALIAGIIDEGFEVVDLGVISTDMLYFAVGNYNFGGGLTVSASHNPKEYNGFKMIKEGVLPISKETGIQEILEDVLKMNDEGFDIPKDFTRKHVHTKEILMDDYIDFMMSFVDLDILKSKNFKIAFNANHGVAGDVITKIIQDKSLPIESFGLYMNQDGTFPQGRPDPLYELNQSEFKKVIVKNQCNMGVAWDADADRCFFFNSNGEFIDGYYTVAILSKIMLEKYPNSKIIHDPRLTWAIIDTVKENSGIPLVNKVGHSFIKARMREENAVFAGENSGHYYFKDYYFADNGILPFLLLLEYIIKENKTIEELTLDYQNKYFISGEINLQVKNIDKILQEMESEYNKGKIEYIDGLSVEFEDWRFNVRVSNTEPLLRVSVESKNKKLLDKKIKELLDLINSIS